jgi:8-oxo-dGTP pyrophosphatase MutT (NUDIX family)
MAKVAPPPAYGSAGEAKKSVTGFVSIVDPYEKHFGNFQSRKPIDLPDGYIAKPIWLIEKKYPPSQEEVARANLLGFGWEPKKPPRIGSQAQRCPFISVDNFTVLFTQAMHERGEEPKLILGLWDKEVEIFGVKQRVRGLALGGGGHYERCARKADGFEPGDMSLRAAADKELNEEVGISRGAGAGRIVTRELGFIDDPLQEPRAHYERFVYLRWVEQEPKPSSELKKILMVPLSIVPSLCDRRIGWTDPTDGAQLGLVLGHDKLLRLIMSHPDTQSFLANVATFYDTDCTTGLSQQAMVIS